MKYEYIQLGFDFGDLEKMNRLSGDGWRVVQVVPGRFGEYPYIALMEREIK